MTNNTAYWNSVYKIETATKPSPFLKHCLASTSEFQIKQTDTVLDLGCGSGRDLIHLRKLGIQAYGVDQSIVATHNINTALGDCRAFCCYFDSLSTIGITPSVAYARFALHAIDLKSEKSLLYWVANNLAPGGKLLLECRTIHDPLFGKGEKLSDCEFIHGHYRRFLDGTLVNRLIQCGFKSIHTVVSNGLAPYENEDPIVMRIAAISGR